METLVSGNGTRLPTADRKTNSTGHDRARDLVLHEQLRAADLCMHSRQCAMWAGTTPTCSDGRLGDNGQCTGMLRTFHHIPYSWPCFALPGMTYDYKRWQGSPHAAGARGTPLQCLSQGILARLFLILQPMSMARLYRPRLSGRVGVAVTLLLAVSPPPTFHRHSKRAPPRPAPAPAPPQS